MTLRVRAVWLVAVLAVVAVLVVARGAGPNPGAGDTGTGPSTGTSTEPAALPREGSSSTGAEPTTSGVVVTEPVPEEGGHLDDPDLEGAGEDPLPVWRTIWQFDRTQLEVIARSELGGLPTGEATKAAAVATDLWEATMTGDGRNQFEGWFDTSRRNPDGTVGDSVCCPAGLVHVAGAATWPPEPKLIRVLVVYQPAPDKTWRDTVVFLTRTGLQPVQPDQVPGWTTSAIPQSTTP